MSSIPTTTTLRSGNRRLDRLRAGVISVRAELERGATLHLHCEHGRRIWRLSSGIFITPEIADAVIRDPHVVGAGDCLFDSYISQTFRWIVVRKGQKHE
jgi:hypothetical protein